LVFALYAPPSVLYSAIPLRLKWRAPIRRHIALTSSSSPSSSSHTSYGPACRTASAARSVRSTISTGSLPGTIVVRNATRSVASGTIGVGSRAQSVARHSVTTFTSRNSSISAVAPIIPTVAAYNTGLSVRSGTAIEDSSQPKNVASNANANSVISSVVTGRRWASRRIRTRPPASSAVLAGPASTL
jgi:hypothetical protein